MITKDEAVLTEEQKQICDTISKEGLLWCPKQLNEKDYNKTEENNMTTTSYFDFINECGKCIDMCEKEYSNDFAEWIKTLILNEIAGKSDTKNDIDDKAIQQEN